MSLQACAEIVKRGDPDRFLAVMAAPPGAREVLFPLYAFNVEVARAPWVTDEPAIAEMRLQWWRDALEEIGGGGRVRSHEVTTPLAGVLDGKGARSLDALVAARRWDIYKDAFEDAVHFDEYLDATSGGLLWIAARALAAEEESAVRAAGWAQGLANWFLAIPELEARGRIPLVDGRPEAISALAATGLEKLDTARAALRAMPGSAAPVLFAVWQTRQILSSAAANPQRVAEGALRGSEARRKLALMWTSATRRW
ncbi:MAG: squalene/phytoene synthase family protein [Pseudomonadota bacterium]